MNTTNIILPEGYTFKTIKDNTYSKKPKFQMYGDKSMKDEQPYNFDWLELAENLSPNETYTLRMLRDNRELVYGSDLSFSISKIEYKSKYDMKPIIRFNPAKQLNKRDYKRFRDSLPKLLALQLVLRPVRGQYMINPWLIVPNNFEEHAVAWMNALAKSFED